jgi:hypothetical protein
MPVMGTCVHLSERIDLMSEIRAIGFVVPALDPRNVGVNADWLSSCVGHILPKTSLSGTNPTAL